MRDMNACEIQRSYPSELRDWFCSSLNRTGSAPSLGPAALGASVVSIPSNYVELHTSGLGEADMIQWTVTRARRDRRHVPSDARTCIGCLPYQL